VGGHHEAGYAARRRGDRRETRARAAGVRLLPAAVQRCEVVGDRRSEGRDDYAHPPRKDKPILFYGTSITHGACASRTGMCFVNILGRRLDRPMLNFGFSGNGRMEVEVVKFLAELDPAIFVLDCVANTSPQWLTERTGPVVKLLRERHAETPILLVEQRAWANSPIVPSQATSHRERCDAYRAEYDKLIAGA
jgi:hypothetical protein